MPKPRPVEVHQNSRGKKYLKLQELIYSEGAYWYLPVNGSLKTDYYNKGLVDARKQALKLEGRYTDCEPMRWVFVFEREKIKDKVLNESLMGCIPLDLVYVIDSKEVNNFYESVCQYCDLCGTPKCYEKIDIDCGSEDRDRYRDSSHFEYQKELRKARKKKPFPKKVGGYRSAPCHGKFLNLSGNRSFRTP